MIAAVIPAAGRGERTGLKENKIFYPVSGKPMLVRTAEVFLSHPMIDRVVVVCAPDEEARVRKMLGEKVTVVPGGETRQASVGHGLKALPENTDVVLVHDAARPFITHEVISRVIDAVSPGSGAVAGVPVTDTVKETDEERFVTRTPDRSRLWQAQTPQGFPYRELVSAYENAEAAYTDDAAVFEAFGGRVKMVMGDYANKKITTREDIGEMAVFHTGFGLDVHQLVEGRKLILGGVEIPYEKGLDGHSDADVLIHAIMDALLGAAGLRDIGTHFPDTDPRYKGISSLLLLREVVKLLSENGWQTENVSAVIAAQKPKLAPFIEAMNENVAQGLGLARENVNVAATTTEHLGFEGRGEGISARATVLIVRR